MAVKVANLSEKKKYLKHLESWSDYLLGQIKQVGFVSASAVYAPYSPHWIQSARIKRF